MYRDNSYQPIILARLKAEELLRRARMKRFGKNEITQKKSHIEHPAKPNIRALFLQLPGCHAFCKKYSKKHAPALRFRKKALIAGERLASWRQIALSEYRQGELQADRPRLRERVGVPSIPLRRRLRRAPAFCLKPIIK